LINSTSPQPLVKHTMTLTTFMLASTVHMYTQSHIQ